MGMTRATGKLISRMLMGVLLFAQLAVASYACPGLKGMQSMSSGSAATATLMAAADASSDSQTAGMPPDCDRMDPDAANLCAEHCRQGQQSVDTTPAHLVGLAFATFLYSIPLEPQHSLGSGRSSPAPDARLHAAPEPPHAILHCVFRI